MNTAYLSPAACSAHLERQDHPDLPARLTAIHDRLIKEGLMDYLAEFDAPAATGEQLERVHSAAHVARMFAAAPLSGAIALDSDTLMDADTLRAALHAAGAVIRATDLVLEEKVQNAFCAVRPPGHHATRDAAMGFCFFNNVAAGAAHAMAVHGLRRIAIIDFDAHHGNGTGDIFQGDERVLFCSSFQRDLFAAPAPGQAAQGGLFIDLPAGSKGDVFRAGVERTWIPALREFQPEMIYVSAGFDAHVADPISDLCFSDNDFAWISGVMVELAQMYAGGRIVSVLEGGYELVSLARCAAAHVKALLDG